MTTNKLITKIASEFVQAASDGLNPYRCTRGMSRNPHTLRKGWDAGIQYLRLILTRKKLKQTVGFDADAILERLGI